MPRRQLEALVLALLLVAAGGAAILAENGTLTDGPSVTYPEPPDNLTNDTATQAAVDHAEARLEDEVSDEHQITSFTMGYLRPVNATVVNQSDGGVYVRIDGTYSYETENAAADFIPFCSLYHVNTSDISYVGEGNCDE